MTIDDEKVRAFQDSNRMNVRASIRNERDPVTSCANCKRSVAEVELVRCVYCGSRYCTIDCYSPHLDLCES